MSTTKMFYIQNYDYKESKDKERVNFTNRFLSGQYMGSAEFEFGSVQKAWKWMREHYCSLYSHSVRSKGGKESLVTFYVITNQTGFERFKTDIECHMDGNVYGSITKERTNLWEKFNCDNPIGKQPDAWLDVSMFVSMNYDEPAPWDNAIFFTADPNIALRTLLELKRANVNSKINIFDEVYTYKGTNAVKVCGLNEDDTISVKMKYGKAVKYHPDDVWSKEDLVKKDINEKIKVDHLKFIF